MTHEIETTSVTIPITADNLPKGPRWEDDGSCWKAIRCNPATQGCDWRWQPINEKAFAKDGPEGEMRDYPPDAFAKLSEYAKARELDELRKLGNAVR
jgi:hypothetical protein